MFWIITLSDFLQGIVSDTIRVSQLPLAKKLSQRRQGHHEKQINYCFFKAILFKYLFNIRSLCTGRDWFSFSKSCLTSSSKQNMSYMNYNCYKNKASSQETLYPWILVIDVNVVDVNHLLALDTIVWCIMTIQNFCWLKIHLMGLGSVLEASGMCHVPKIYVLQKYIRDSLKKYQ